MIARIRIQDHVLTRPLDNVEAAGKPEGGIREEHDIKWIEVVTKDDHYFDMYVPFEPADHKEYYLLYVTRRSGDAYSIVSGILQLVSLYSSAARAADDAAIIRRHYDIAREMETIPGIVSKDFDSSVVLLKGEGDEPITLGVDWIGFYDSLETVEVRAVRTSPPIWWKF